MQQIAEKYELHSNQITSWKKQFLGNAEQAFGSDKSVKALKKAEQEREELYKQIGQMKVETDFLKKSCNEAALKPPGDGGIETQAPGHLGAVPAAVSASIELLLQTEGDL